MRDAPKATRLDELVREYAVAAIHLDDAKQLAAAAMDAFHDAEAKRAMLAETLHRKGAEVVLAAGEALGGVRRGGEKFYLAANLLIRVRRDGVDQIPLTLLRMPSVEPRIIDRV